MKFLFRLLSLILLFQSESSSQNFSEPALSDYSVQCKGNERVVVSLNGLKMRATPGSDGKVITIIPFSELVEVIAFTDELEKDIEVNGFYGKWLPVKYKQHEGFVFSSFLSWGLMKMTQQYYLLIPDGGCGENNYFSSSYNYYGFFKSDYGDAPKIKKIAPVFYTSVYRTVVKVDSIIQPLFVIASKNELKEGLDQSSCSLTNLFSTPGYNPTKGKRTVGLSNGEFLLEVENFNSADSVIKKLYLKNRQTKKMQLISESFFSFKLIWDGDLDKDGKPDFILFTGFEKSGGYQLFLSSKAKKGEFVSVAATFDSGICC